MVGQMYRSLRSLRCPFCLQSAMLIGQKGNEYQPQCRIYHWECPLGSNLCEQIDLCFKTVKNLRRLERC